MQEEQIVCSIYKIHQIYIVFVSYLMIYDVCFFPALDTLYAIF